MTTVNAQIAYILHKRSYRETSSIIDVLTKNHGRISLMARGVRGAKSKLAANFLLFTPLVISWHGKGELPYLKSIERADLKPPVLKQKALLSAMYINELLSYLLHKNDVHEHIFEHYHTSIYALEDSSVLEITLRRFETGLLSMLGFGVNVEADAETGEAIKTGVSYRYFIEHGPVMCRDDSAFDQQIDHPRVSGECLRLLAAENYSQIAASRQYSTELKQLMRYIINYHLDGRRLKSRDMFRPIPATK